MMLKKQQVMVTEKKLTIVITQKGIATGLERQFAEGKDNI